jgi:hypothetical protein
VAWLEALFDALASDAVAVREQVASQPWADLELRADFILAYREWLLGLIADAIVASFSDDGREVAPDA